MSEIFLYYPQKTGTISPEIYGHFTEHIGGVFYDGIYVGKDSSVPNIRGFRTSLIEKLKAIEPSVIRWPGGCFAETYDWRDGIGSERPVRPNWWTPNDGRYETNAVGTHEFMDFCETVGAHAYVAANLTSVTPMHIRNWMDYCLSPRGSTTLALEREKNGHPEPFDAPFWGVGNENWGGGGNMRPEYYADEYRRFATVMNNVSSKAELYCCGTNGADYSWAHGVTKSFAEKKVRVNGFAMHYYCGKAGDPLNFTEDEWNEMMLKAGKMDEIIKRNWAIISAWGMQDKMKLVVDEWGCWHPDGSGPSKGYNLFEQQSTMRDAVVSALTLNIFNRNCDKVRMANVAQLVNNLHCLFLAGGDGFTVTPTYHVFDMYKGHKGGEAIGFTCTDSDISVSVSVKEGKTTLTAANLTCTSDRELSISAAGATIPERGNMRLLAADDMHAHNTFEDPERVKPVQSIVDLSHPVLLPAASVIALEF